MISTGSIPRRYFLNDCAIGLGKIAAASLLASSATAAKSARAADLPKNPLAPRQPHFAPKAKAVIHLFMTHDRS